MKHFFVIFCFASLLFAGCGIFEGGKNGMNDLFADMENGIRTGDEELFKKHWKSEGYAGNLVGGSGMEGGSVFRQGNRKKWFLKPDYSKTIKQGNVEIYECAVYAYELDRDVDEIFLAVSSGDRKILGGGESLEEVRKLAERYNNGEDLAPPK